MDSAARGMAAAALKRASAYCIHSIATLGDSRLAQAYTSHTLGVTTRTASNFITQGLALMGQRLNIVSPNAVSGLRSDQYMAADKVAAAFASNAYWLLTGGVVNDIAATGNATDYFTTYIKPVCDAWIASGRAVILMTETGATNMAASAANMGAVYAYNRKVRQYCAETANAVLFDVQSVVCDPTQVMAFKTNYSGDGTHVSLLPGAYALGQAFANLMTPLVPPLSRLVETVGETPARGGVQWVSDPLFQTTTGGNTTTGVSGTVPAVVTGWTLATGHTVAVSTAAGPVGNDLVLNWSTTQAGTSLLALNITGGGTPVGGSIFDASAIEVVAAGSSNYQGMNIHLENNRATSGTRYVESFFTGGSANLALPNTAITYQHQTDPLVMDTTANSWFLVYLKFLFAGAGSATVNIRQAGVFLRQ